MLRLRFVFLLGVVAIISNLLVASGRQSRAADPTPTPTVAIDYSDYRVLSTNELDLLAGPTSTHAQLAPSGDLFLYGNASELCLYTTDGDKQRCTSIRDSRPRLRLDNDSVVWSPDSRRLAFTSQFLITLSNPGLWVMEVATGEITQVTGAELRDFKVGGGADGYFDLSPQWLPDSETLLFLRYKVVNKVITGPYLTTLNIKTATIGERYNLNSPSISVYLMSLTPDGNTVLFNNDGRGDDAERGLWTYSFADNKVTQIATMPDRDRVPIGFAYSTDGRFIAWKDASGFTISPDVTDPTSSPVQFKATGAATAMPLDGTRYVRTMGWSPTGSALVYAVYSPVSPEETGLYLSTTPGEAGTLLLAGNFVAPTSQQRQLFSWAANDTLLVADAERGPKLTIIKLGKR
jgi:dipeptidyl aminopeptidase/acylaminoacyl peptidase